MAFILIGFGRRTQKDFGETGYVLPCVHCSNNVYYHLVCIRTYFTFFFIPIFAYRSQYRVECPVCLHGVELRGAEIKAARQGSLKLYVSND